VDLIDIVDTRTGLAYQWLADRPLPEHYIMWKHGEPVPDEYPELQAVMERAGFGKNFPDFRGKVINTTGGTLMTSTRTHTLTLTKTLEEKAVLEAVKVRKGGRPGRWTMERIMEFIHENHVSTREAFERDQIKEEDVLVDVPDWLSPVIVGQLIVRGLVYRTGNDPEGYTVA
jgi:hypothetical protein